MSGRAQTANDYQQRYPTQCAFSLRFYQENNSLFQGASTSTGLSPKFLFSIVAPELSQYSYLSDKAETYSLIIFYVQGGKAYSDFSIGPFQMKPSFVEKMELFAADNPKLATKYKDLLFQKPDSRTSRVTRIDRLKTPEGQINYLKLFCDIAQIRFSNRRFANDEEKLRFYAAAYNVGFEKTESSIMAIGKKFLFPHFSKQKFRYADVAVWFYNQTP